ncbi:Oxysterol-binding protein-domain-containing protein [Flagelloscypha sp. PMI_526]|nr:Oxysterol-binding protein-domain-containing protein [Flagelloscypha sp. PMI_526]
MEDPDPQSPLYTVSALSALRAGEPAELQRFLSAVAKYDVRLHARKNSSKSGSSELIGGQPNRDLAAELLHLAVKCASIPTLQTLLNHRSISPNAVYGPSAHTPLHVAVSLPRARPEVVKLLVGMDETNDTLLDSDKRTARELAVVLYRDSKGDSRESIRECLRVLDDSLHALSASYQSLLQVYISSGTAATERAQLISLLRSPRVVHLNLNYLDAQTGQSILHTAAQRKDLEILERAIKAGASPLTRNRIGQLPVDLAPPAKSDGGVRGFLKDQTVGRASLTTPDPQSNGTDEDVPGLKGFLNKYTNVARGYNVRWFVLNGGVLSYYKTPLEESVSSRGSISMRSAVLKRGTSGDSLRFEVMSYGSASSKSQPTQRWYLKASHANEADRWLKELERSVEWSRRMASTSLGGPSSLNLPTMVGSSTSIGRSLSFSSKHKNSDSVSGSERESLSGVEGTISSNAGGSLRYSETMKSLRLSGRTGMNEAVSGLNDSTYLVSGDALGDEFQLGLGQETVYDSDASSFSSEENVGETGSTQSKSKRRRPASDKREEELDLLGNTILAAIQGPSSGGSSEMYRMMEEYISLSGEVRRKLKSRLDRERGRGRAWEEAVKSVVQESSQLEAELTTRARHPHKRKRSGSYFGEDTLKASRQLDEKTSLHDVVESIRSGSDPSSPRPAAIEPESPVETLDDPLQTPVPDSVAEADQTSEDDADVDTDDEDEFFDAIESGNLPGLVVPEGLVTSKEPLKTSSRLEEIVEEEVQEEPNATTSVIASPPPTDPLHAPPYTPYSKLRSALHRRNQTMPNTSLWSVLKNSIGKDLTRIAFPVEFNEPTSMLQRMAEDMEFSGCLDIAARTQSPLLRIAYVAAFGMSNYSSTLGRIAKPFNPMLSETFEYVRPDKGYRYVSEQVSHHPPMSACWAESAKWHYYGEVDAQNKFMGKSFEIRPTGVAHAELLIPSSFVTPSSLLSSYPPAKPTLLGAKEQDGLVCEHYSWKKVTTNISGFIFGSPVIDHYGDMVVKNHRTGDTCVLTFKPRGWRGRDAFEIFGFVKDRNGEIAYEIAGRWNSQLIARPFKGAMMNASAMNPDEDVGPQTPTAFDAQSKYILLWRNSVKPPGSPFNLTPYALTLNDCPEDTLKPYLPPTDCRIRPDQRAFEFGWYDHANNLKLKQEDVQRKTRRLRETGTLPRHSPRWFTARTDGDTGERMWAPVRAKDGDSQGLEYWSERERVWEELQKLPPSEEDEEAAERRHWKGVEQIFTDDHPEP